MSTSKVLKILPLSIRLLIQSVKQFYITQSNTFSSSNFFIVFSHSFKSGALLFMWLIVFSILAIHLLPTGADSCYGV